MSETATVNELNIKLIEIKNVTTAYVALLYGMVDRYRETVKEISKKCDISPYERSCKEILHFMKKYELLIGRTPQDCYQSFINRSQTDYYELVYDQGKLHKEKAGEVCYIWRIGGLHGSKIRIKIGMSTDLSNRGSTYRGLNPDGYFVIICSNHYGSISMEDYLKSAYSHYSMDHDTGWKSEVLTLPYKKYAEILNLFLAQPTNTVLNRTEIDDFV